VVVTSETKQDEGKSQGVSEDEKERRSRREEGREKNELTFGNPKPTALAILIPRSQSPPPLSFPLSSSPYSLLGSPKIAQILYT